MFVAPSQEWQLGTLTGRADQPLALEMDRRWIARKIRMDFCLDFPT